MKQAKFLFDSLAGNRLRYILALVMALIISPIPILTNYLVKIIVDDVLEGGAMNLLFPVLATLLSITIIRCVIWYFSRYNCEYASQQMVMDLRNRGFDKIMTLDFSFFDTHKTGSIMTIMTADIDIVRNFIAHILYVTIENSVIFVGALIFMLSVADKSFIFLVAIILPLIVYMAVRLAFEVGPCFRNIREMRARLNTVAQENISANRVVKAFCNEAFEEEKMQQANDHFKAAQYEANRVWVKYMPLLNNIQGVFILYNLVVGGILVIHNQLSMGELVMFNGMVWMITNPLTQVGFIVNDYINSMTSLGKLMEFLAEKPKIKNAPLLADKSSIQGRFEFSNVTFDYGCEGALRNVSFTVEPGQKIAIIGPTGSGKSTIIHLISRFYNVQSGSIFVDHVNISDIDLAVLRQNIAVSQQDVFLFSETVAANIAYGKTNATMEEIVAAAKIAKAHDFICELPDGYDTVVGEMGVGLSGGQKQRLTLARALLKNPSVLVLDDTTSALDAKTEKYIQETLREHFSNKTVFIISQRIASVKDCDLILVLDQGHIVERGTHEQLLANRGYYYSVFKHQYGNFAAEKGVEYYGKGQPV